MSIHNQGTNWFLAQLKPNYASIVDMNLKRQGFKTFLPLEEVSLQRNGKSTTYTRPLFPGYIFVAFNVKEGLWRAVNSTRGITQLLRFGKEPATVPFDVVSQLKLRCDADGILLPPQHLKPGDLVTITKGSFFEFAAEIETIAFNRRVWVLMEIMGRQSRVSLDTAQLKLV